MNWGWNSVSDEEADLAYDEHKDGFEQGFSMDDGFEEDE